MSSAKKNVRRNARARGLSSTDSTDALNISFGSDTENLSIDTSPESAKSFMRAIVAMEEVGHKGEIARTRPPPIHLFA